MEAHFLDFATRCSNCGEVVDIPYDPKRMDTTAWCPVCGKAETVYAVPAGEDDDADYHFPEKDEVRLNGNA